MSGGNFTIRQVDWHREKEQIMMIRNVVFVEEQKVPMEEEMDNLDAQCWFVLAEDETGKPIGTGRLLPGGKIGRLAVLKDHRGHGIGSALLKALIRVADLQSIGELYLHGQIQAKSFYARHGFVEEGPVFEEAGIPHIKMRLTRNR
jgi:predicted GNAT family N-acyltransferase